MLEKALVAHCSPTLAGLKSASMFNYSFTSKQYLYEQLEACRKTLHSKGVSLHVLKLHDDWALLYVYRKQMVQDELRKKDVFNFLSTYGYETDRIDYCIERLASRIISQNGFPHEVGLFLGYPLDDVKGFIRHKGKNCRCVGCWKVYCNECEAKKLFAKFDKCKMVYHDLFHRGVRTVEQLTIAA